MLAAADIHDNNATTALWCLAVVAYAGLRTIRPMRVEDDLQSAIAIGIEVALHVVVVVSTGYWDSPFVFSLVTAIIIAGFARGFIFALLFATLSLASVTSTEFPSTSIPHPLSGPRRARTFSNLE